VNIIVDTNIVFSAILNANGKIGGLLLNSPKSFSFYSPEFMIEEVNRYSDKLLKASKLKKSELLESKFRIFSSIEFISEEVISNNTWIKAFLLTKDIDEDDTPFVALTLEIDGILWTGDKKLISGLKLKDFKTVCSTDELFNLRSY
jgi:predicted nucleic acid-binding protein